MFANLCVADSFFGAVVRGFLWDLQVRQFLPDSLASVVDNLGFDFMPNLE